MYTSRTKPHKTSEQLTRKGSATVHIHTQQNKKSTILSSGAQARRAFTARCQSLPSTACDSHSLPACDLAGCPSNYPPSLGHRLKKHQQSKTPSFLHCSYHAHLKKKKNSNHTRAKECCKHTPWVDIQSTLWKAASTPLGWIFKARCEKLQAHPLGGYSKHAVKSFSHSFRATCDMSTMSLLESGE